MPQKKNNHITPKCLLKEWITIKDGLPGVYVYELESRKTYFSTSKGKSAFSFAIEPYFYVPKVKGERVFHLENWLAGIEATLADFIRKLRQGVEGVLFKNKGDFDKVLLALFSLKTRTKYSLSKIKEHLLINPEVKAKIEIEKNTDIELVVLENLINSTIEIAIEYSNCEINVCKSNSKKLILGDTPFLFEAFDGYSFIALSPDFFISLRKTDKKPYYTYHDEVGDSLIDLYNEKIAESSRHWIISSSKDLLNHYVPMALRTKIEIPPRYEDVRFLQGGYKLS